MLTIYRHGLIVKKLRPFWAVYNRNGQVLYRSLKKANCSDFVKRYTGINLEWDDSQLKDDTK